MPVVKMPNGDLVEFPNDMPDEEIGSFIQSKFPDAFKTTALGQVGETLKAIPRGFARSLLTAGEGAAELADAVTNKVGLENLIDSGDDNALVAAARQGQKALNESWLGVDDAYQDAWMTKFGEGLGSMASFLTPGGALKLAGIGSRAARLGATVPLVQAIGSGEGIQRVEQARAEGIEVSEAQEDAAVLLGAAIGLTELAPVDRLLRGLDRSKLSDDLKINIMQRLASAMGSGGVEALQETSASLMQDLAEREIYNPDLQLGQEAWDSFTVGGAVGFTADLVLNAMGVRRDTTRKKSEEADELQKRNEEEERRETVRRQYESVESLRGGRPVEETVVEEVDAATIEPETEDMGRYGRNIARRLGQNFPTDTSFTVEPVDVPLTPEELAAETPQYGPDAGQPMATVKPAFQVYDSTGQAYGTPRLEYEESAVLAGTLNKQIIDQSTRNTVTETIQNTPEQYDAPTSESLDVIGNRIKNPRANEITADTLNFAAETTIDKGFDEALSADEAMQRNMGRVFTEQEMVNSLTASQRVNRKRLAKGMPETSTFTVEEAKDVLGDDFGRLGDVGAGGIVETQTYEVSQDKKGNPIVVSSAGEVITTNKIERLRKKDGKPYTQTRKIKTVEQAQRLAERLNSRYNSTVDEVVFEDIKAGNAELKSLLERKNIPDDLESPAIKTMAKAFVGKENVNDMSAGEKKFFYQKIRKLPVVPSPLAEGLPDFNQTTTLTEDTTVTEEPLALPAPDAELASPELVADMQERLDAELKRKNLTDKGVTGKIFQQYREYGLNQAGEPVFSSEVIEDAEGAYLADFNQIAFGIQQAIAGKDVDMNDPDAVFAAIKDILNHETVHALRTLDLFTAEEYQVLERAAENTKRKGEDITYLAAIEANPGYKRLSRAQQMEEAIAELVRQNTTLGGRPRTIINKIKDILGAIARWITGSSPSVQRIVENIESGKVGGREAGKIRTLRATRKEQDVYEREDLKAPEEAGRVRMGDTLEEFEAQQLDGLDEIEAAVAKAETAHSRLGIDRQVASVVQMVVPFVNKYRKGKKLNQGAATKKVMEFYRSLPEQKAAGKPNPKGTFENAFKTLDRAKLASREELSYQDVTIKIPEIAVATILYKDGLITRAQRNRVVDKFKPVTPYKSLPDELLTKEKKALDALDANKKPKFKKSREAIAKENLEYVSLRLDIPAYLKDGSWVVALHRPKAAQIKDEREPFTGLAQGSIGYELAFAINNVSFGTAPESRWDKLGRGVATSGGTKSTFAVINGKPEVGATDGSLIGEARAILKDMSEGKPTEWTQVGYDPERHAYYYDRATGQPVGTAERVIQVGPLVLAKNINTNSRGEPLRVSEQEFSYSRREEMPESLKDAVMDKETGKWFDKDGNLVSSPARKAGMMQDREDNLRREGGLEKAYREGREARMSRRKFLGKLAATGIGGAAAITNLQNSDTVTLGRAKPVSIEVLETPLSDEARTLLQVAWSSPDPLGINGSAAIKEVLSNPSYFPSELQKLAADIGKLMPASGVQLDFKEGNWNVAGTVSVSIPATLTLYGERGLDTGTFLHEALHANVVSRWRSLSLMAGKQGERGQRQRDRLGITPAESEAYLQFENIWEEFKDASNKDFTGMDKSNSNYISLDQSRSSIDEFFVRALTDANFQKYLSTKRYEGKTLLERFKNWVAETIFGSRSGEEASWLDAALTASGDLSATLSTRTPDFAVVERVNEINNGPLASAPEQEISYSRRGVNIPEASSTAPILPIGEVEAELQALLDRTNGNPTSRQLANITGAPTPRAITNKAGKKVIDKKRDGEVKPTSLAELRAMARRGLQEGKNDLRWYDQFGTGLGEIIGNANIEEASVIFGITSQQNSAEQNLADTLHIMSVARRIDPVESTAAFIKEVKEGTRPNGQKVKITGDQINRIVRMYNEGYASAGLKTSTYMQLIQDRARNRFNPFSVQDVHMARAFGFRRKNYKDGRLVDAAMIPGDLQYRYAQYLTSYLAQEFGVTPNQMQAALWFVAKDTLSPKKGKAGAGTWNASRKFSQPEVNVIQEQIEDGVFDTTSPLTSALEKGVRPRNAPKVKQDPYTNYLQIEELTELAAQRGSRVLTSANPGNARGYGFPESVSLEEIVAFNKGALDVITDQDGQIPFIRKMGIPHVVEASFGTYEGIEPNIQIRLLDGTLEQADFVGNVLGDALLQDAVVTEKPIYDQGSQVGIAVTKPDGSPFTEAEVMAVAAKANPEKDPYGLNFTLVNDGKSLAFTDGRTFVREELPDYTPEMAEEFSDKVLNAFDNAVQYVYNQYTQQGNYYESEGYSGNIRGEGNTESFPGSSDILSAANDTLYKPFWDYYTAEAERIGFTPQNLARPVSSLSRVAQPELVEPRSIPPAELEAAAEQNLEALENTTGGAVPTFSVKASPEAQAVARNPDLGAKPTAEQEIFYSRRRPSDPEVRAAVDKTVQPDYGNKGILHNLLSFMSPSTKDEYKSAFSRFRQGYINRYEPLEKMDNMIREKLGTLADSSAFFAMIMGDRASNQTAGSIKHGVTSYDSKAGIFKVKDFVYQGKKVDGLLGVLKPLMASENVYGEPLLEVFQGYAIAKRAKEINDSGKLSPVPKGEEAAYLAEMEAMAAKYINPETGQSYITEVYDMYQAYNNEVIKLMKNSGLITDAEARSWERSSVYYPFYKDFDADPNSETNQETSDGKLVNVDSILNVGMENSPSFLPQEKIGSKKLRRLEGSRLRIDVPPLEAMVKNLDAAINMSMKNIAYQRAMRDAVYLGFASKIEKGRKMKALKKGEISNSVYIREKGRDVHYKVHDQLLFAALTPIADGSLVSNITMVTSIPARFLRESITRSPGFMGVNMLRDTMSAFVTSGAKFIPIVDTVKKFKMSTDQFEEFERLGIVTGYDNLGDPKDLAAYMEKQLRKKGVDTGASRGKKAWENSLGKAWDILGAGTTRSDFATRSSVYDDTLARTNNQAEAMFQAIEVLNFGRRGGNAAYRMIAAATPFLNARIQGLDVLWRTGLGTYSSRSDLGKAQIQRNAFLRASYLTALTAAYWMLVSDDDQYKEASDYVKDNNWLIPNPFGTQPIKIPIPFEIGLLFKTFPEKALDATFKDATARDFEQTVERGVLSTLEMNPLGMFQITAPIVEIAVNKNFYTGRQIVPYYIDQGVVAGLQDTLTTSQFAEWLGQSTGMSPMKIDHVLNGYAGSLGSLFLDTTDMVLRTPSITGDFSDAMPSMSLSEHPATRRFFARAEGTGLSEDFYEMNRYVQQVVQTLGKLEREGRIEEYQKFLYGREHLVDLQKDFNSIRQDLSDLRKEKQEIIRMDIDPDVKREQVDEIDRMVNEMLQIVPELKEMVKLPLFGQLPFVGEDTFRTP